jgi:hypothetical protein
VKFVAPKTTALDSSMKSERLRFDVFGRRIDVERTEEGWAAFVPGIDGKRRPAQIAIPPEFEADEISRYLGDLFHESASPKHPTVRLL